LRGSLGRILHALVFRVLFVIHDIYSTICLCSVPGSMQ
jgi:hypothetical protein